MGVNHRLLCQACLGYTDQDCGDHRFDVHTPSPLHFDTRFCPKGPSYSNGQAIICGSLAIQGCSRRDRILIASAGSTRFNDMLGSVYVILSLYRGVPRGAAARRMRPTAPLLLATTFKEVGMLAPTAARPADVSPEASSRQDHHVPCKSTRTAARGDGRTSKRQGL